MKTIKKNTVVTVNHILGETAEALVTPVGENKYQFDCNAYVIGERSKGGYFHLRQAREIIPGKKLGNNVKFWPRLRKALHEAGLKSVNIPGGDYPIHYCDEIVIPDFSMSGAHYFVIKRDDIGNYLAKLPLDDAGKTRADEIKRKKVEEEAEAYSQEHDPKCIAAKIGNKLFSEGGLGGEFTKITLVSDNDEEFSVIYPSKSTDLLWDGCANVSKIVCEATETGIDFLSGWKAGHIDPRNHCRIKKEYCSGWSRNVAYLMPDPKLATEVRECYRWLDMFDNSDNDGVSSELIATAKKVILEGYDLYDKILEKRYVYDRDSKEVTKEYLHNNKNWSTEKELM